MVERPIKKSERQAKVGTDNNSENADSMPPVESNSRKTKGKSDRSSGKGKKGSYGDESRPPVNPALARGPKPVKAKPKVTAEPETEEANSTESEEATSEA